MTIFVLKFGVELRSWARGSVDAQLTARPPTPDPDHPRPTGTHTASTNLGKIDAWESRPTGTILH